jgi:CheB methylesterase
MVRFWPGANEDICFRVAISDKRMSANRPKMIKDRGGFTIVQEPAEATARSMPLSAIRHMKIDKVCTLQEMARLFIELANDDPPRETEQSVQELMQIEDRIAEGVQGKVIDAEALD